MRVLRTVGKQLSKIHIVGAANGNAGHQAGCEEAAGVMRNSPILKASPLQIEWGQTVKPRPTGTSLAALPGVIEFSRRLAKATEVAVRQQRRLLVIGGDHSCAIGTWSGVASALRANGPLGLIWVDAHLDSHTPDSSDTGNIHGMPVAHLLGYGNTMLRHVGDPNAKILPQHLAFVGIRSFEPAEQELVESIGVRVFYMDEVRSRGINDVMQEALDIASSDTAGFGMSIDIDGFRIEDAPAVGTPVEGGIDACQFMEAVKRLDLSRLIATEIVEFLPQLDQNSKSERLVVDLIETIHARFQTVSTTQVAENQMLTG
uniref:Arginase n=1 Tax=Plectus sambesii TaxID=2011161 RepID=A0A914WKX6_9BILA